ncbi:MAG: EI24 domain-containing protein [Pseudomonadota bacterium]|nr:EI24 domain-containing protein [Pseudomonadota bacterium]
MNAIFDSFWRAAAYCLHPRVILWSLLPVLLAGSLVAVLGWLFWENSVAAVRGTMQAWSMLDSALQWLDSVGLVKLHALLAPLVVVALSVPGVIVLTLLMVAVAVTPAVVRLVTKRRFPTLQKRHGATWWQSLGWSLACTLAAVLALILSLPLWLVPPLVMILPPLIWGWLTYRVFSFDVLSLHASAEERRLLLRSHRLPLLGIGIACGYLGALPSFIWAFSALTLIFAPLLALLSVWLYTLVFAFAACWFAHYALAALQQLRDAALVPAPFVSETP